MAYQTTIFWHEHDKHYKSFDFIQRKLRQGYFQFIISDNYI